MPIQTPDLPAPSPLELADPFHAPEAVRRRIRARWARRRAETAGRTELSLVSVTSRDSRPRRRAATADDTRRCLESPAFAARRFAEVEKVSR